MLQIIDNATKVDIRDIRISYFSHCTGTWIIELHLIWYHNFWRILHYVEIFYPYSEDPQFLTGEIVAIKENQNMTLRSMLRSTTKCCECDNDRLKNPHLALDNFLCKCRDTLFLQQLIAIQRILESLKLLVRRIILCLKNQTTMMHVI